MSANLYPEVNMTNVRDELAAFLESSGPGWEARCAKLGISRAVAVEAKARWSGRVLTPSTTVADVLMRLGEPDVRDGSTLLYRLPYRPKEYVFGFVFDDAGSLRETGFRRSDDRAMPGWLSGGESIAAGLAAIGATSQELVRWLGTPSDSYGWWPFETWTYHGIELNLRLSVVEIP